MAKEMYTLILTRLKTYNERLWFTTSLRLARMYLDGQQFAPLEQMLKDRAAGKQVSFGNKRPRLDEPISPTELIREFLKNVEAAKQTNAGPKRLNLAVSKKKFGDGGSGSALNN